MSTPDAAMYDYLISQDEKTIRLELYENGSMLLRVCCSDCWTMFLSVEANGWKWECPECRKITYVSTRNVANYINVKTGDPRYSIVEWIGIWIDTGEKVTLYGDRSSYLDY